MVSNSQRLLVRSGVHVLSPDGAQLALPTGNRLTFGRGHEADLFVPGGRDLSRRAGGITALAAGAWVENLSRTHALYVAGDGYHVRLPASGADGPPGGWLLSQGAALVGSMAMIRNDLALRVTVAPEAGSCLLAALTANSGSNGAVGSQTEESTVRPMLLRPGTKLYLVALMLCRPWLFDPSRSVPLPTAPQLAQAVLEFTSARRQLERFDRDPVFRAGVVGQVNDHLKYLRERIQSAGLASASVRLAPTVIAQALLDNDVITRADLATVENPEWRSQQEDLWWRTRS